MDGKLFSIGPSGGADINAQPSCATIEHVAMIR